MGINATKQGAVNFKGNLLILAGPRSAFPDDLSTTGVSDLEAATAVDLTYAFTDSGWKESPSQDTITDDRLTAPQSYAAPGSVTNALTVQYVFGSGDDVADPLLVEGEEIVFAVRKAVSHNKAIAVGDKFEFKPVTCGVKQPDDPSGTGKFTYTQQMFPSDEWLPATAITAGS